MDWKDSATQTNEGVVALTQVYIINAWFRIIIMRVEMWKEDVNIQHQKKSWIFFLQGKIMHVRCSISNKTNCWSYIGFEKQK